MSTKRGPVDLGRERRQGRETSVRPMIRLGALAAALAAVICCNIGPAWSPDGKSVIFSYPIAEDVMGLARYELETEEVTSFAISEGYSCIRAAFGDDGTLYAIAQRSELANESGSEGDLSGGSSSGGSSSGGAPSRAESPKDPVDDDEEEPPTVEYLDYLRFDGDEPRVLATMRGENGTLLFGAVFVHEGRIWSWLGAEAPRDDSDTTELRVVCVDVETGEKTFPFGESSERLIAPILGPAGLFYVETIDLPVDPSRPPSDSEDEDPKPPKELRFGRAVPNGEGGYDFDVWWTGHSERGDGFGASIPVVVGDERVILLLQASDIANGDPSDDPSDDTSDDPSDDASDDTNAAAGDAGNHDAGDGHVGSEDVEPDPDAADERPWAVVFDRNGTELNRVRVSSGQGMSAYALSKSGAWLWSNGDQGEYLERVHLESGRLERFALSDYGIKGNAIAFGMSGSPTEQKIAVQVFPREEEDFDSVPGLLIFDESVDSPTAKVIDPPRG